MAPIVTSAWIQTLHLYFSRHDMHFERF